MKNWIRKWLGIDNLEAVAVCQRAEIIGINTYLDSRAPCKICGHHRYIKKAKRYDEIERDRKNRRKNHGHRNDTDSREI